MTLDIEPIQKDIRELRKYLKRASKLPTPQEIHSLRTHARRFEAVFQAVEFNSSPNELQALRTLKRVRRLAGKVRDFDVFTGYATMAPPQQERDCLVHLLEYFGAERYRRSEQLHALMTQKGPSLRRWLKRASDRLATLASRDNETPGENETPADNETPAAGRTAEDATTSLLRLRQELTIPVRLDKNNLHPYRLKLKKLRYVLQMQKNPDEQQFIEALGEAKDAIGDWHDWQQLVTVAKKQLQHGSKCELLHSFQIIADRKYKHALLVTGKMRKHFLPASSPAKKSVSGSKPAARDIVAPVTHAISA